MPNPNSESLLQGLSNVAKLLPLLLLFVPLIVYGYRGVLAEPQNLNLAYDNMMKIDANWSKHESELLQRDTLETIKERSYGRQHTLIERIMQVNSSTDRYLFLQDWEATARLHREKMGWDIGRLEQFDESYFFLYDETIAVRELLSLEEKALVALTQLLRVHIVDSSTQAEKDESTNALLSLIPVSNEVHGRLAAMYRKNIDKLDTIEAVNIGGLVQIRRDLDVDARSYAVYRFTLIAGIFGFLCVAALIFQAIRSSWNRPTSG